MCMATDGVALVEIQHNPEVTASVRKKAATRNFENPLDLRRLQPQAQFQRLHPQEVAFFLDVG